MKRTIYSISALLVLFLAGVAFAACHSEPEPPIQGKVAFADMQLSMGLEPSLAEYVEVTGTFVDANGEEHVVQMEPEAQKTEVAVNNTRMLYTTSFKQTATQFPATMTASFQFRQTKEPAPEHKCEIKVYFVPYIRLYRPTGRGENIATTTLIKGVEQKCNGYKGKDLYMALNFLNDTFKDKTLTIDEDGNCTIN